MKLFFLILLTIFNLKASEFHREVFKTSHNSFEFNSTLLDHLNIDQFKGIEFDLHTRRNLIKRAPKNDFFVHHALFDNKSSFPILSKALDEVKEYQVLNPNHGPITIFIDLKMLFQTKRKMIILNNLLLNKFKDNLYTYQQFLDSCPDFSTNAKLALSKCGWPSTENLKNKILVVLTSGNLEKYFDKLKYKTAFLASSSNNITRHTAFINEPYSTDLSPLLKIREEAKYPIRLYQIKNKDIYNHALQEKINFISIDENLK